MGFSICCYRNSICFARYVCFANKGFISYRNRPQGRLYRICRKANISSRAKRGISTNSICGHRCSACQKKRTENVKHSLSFSCRFEYTALWQAHLCRLFLLFDNKIFQFCLPKFSPERTKKKSSATHSYP